MKTMINSKHKFLTYGAVLFLAANTMGQTQGPPAPPAGAFQPPQVNQQQQPNAGYYQQQQQYNYPQQGNMPMNNPNVRRNEIDYNQNMASLMAQNNLECSSIYRGDNTGVPQNPLMLPADGRH